MKKYFMFMIMLIAYAIWQNKYIYELSEQTRYSNFKIGCLEDKIRGLTTDISYEFSKIGRSTSEVKNSISMINSCQLELFDCEKKILELQKQIVLIELSR